MGVGIEPDAVQQLGWVDDALAKLGRKRRIRVFTRHYQAAMKLAPDPPRMSVFLTRNSVVSSGPS